ncbi:cytochrome b [Devosia riboflavina]
MSSTPAPDGYSRAQVILHWLIAALILFQLLVHDGMEEAWRAMRRASEEGGNPLPHIIVGSAILILILAAVRLVIRLRHGAPPHPAGQPAALALLANVVHWGIYALLFMIPISGLVAWFGGVEGAASVHGGPLRLLLIGLVLLHIAGALVQQFVLRSGVLMRMLKPES